ncbi:sigma 54-interacting transcriptional regulator [Hyalangium sp.]|uniref:sigma 54-interacting transcriptional regulator n=1 Tax=Hyalangium sp. TaxID=2028555 RepID=UPI002D733668|nr:sigma 54-interacting transcriptional regulator [Hyalangium sp.]HYI01353.1 sigma 54-interacting transcriptional regulator [Hyalangium sp.]
MHESTIDDAVLRAKTDAPPLPGGILIFANGEPALFAVALRDGKLVFGRSLAESVLGRDLRLSREHAEITLDNSGAWTVTDLASRNGTFVDGEAVRGQVRRADARWLRAGNSLLVLSKDIRPYLAQVVEVSAQGDVVGPAIRPIYDALRVTAEAGRDVLIRGESGTGKELAARCFHRAVKGPFIAVNCAAIPSSMAERLLFGARKGSFTGATDAEGYVQAAEGGVLFLDEVGELGEEVQAKLLRLLGSREVLPLGATQPKTVNVRVCAATHRQLRGRAGFREDLYFRLSATEVVLPPLRERFAELPALVTAEVRRAAPEVRVNADFIEACLSRAWPGNVRELGAEVAMAVRAAALDDGRELRVTHLRPSAGLAIETVVAPADEQVQPPPDAGPPSREAIEAAIADCGGNLAAAATRLGINRSRLYREMKRQGVAVTRPRSN